MGIVNIKSYSRASSGVFCYSVGGANPAAQLRVGLWHTTVTNLVYKLIQSLPVLSARPKQHARAPFRPWFSGETSSATRVWTV
jgi:hypothetical protein